MTSAATPPHQTNLANKLDPRVDTSSTKPAKKGAYVPNTTSDETGPAPNTAGPHKSDLANQLDPRVDSDLNNRAQYAPGMTTTGNTHKGATTVVNNPDSSNKGPHSSSLLNKLDPRVNSKTGEMTTKTTNGQGTGSAREPTNYGTDSNPSQKSDWSRSGVVPGSSTGAPAAPSTAASSNYNKEIAQQYNSATGTGYNPHSSSSGQQSSSSQGQQASNTQSGKDGGNTNGNTTTGSNGGGISGSIRRVLAGIHVS
ncbi:hypothetical protein VTN77DRAFT_3615 [Rasamsonia byssochlamydoides]|uniref:uncharacterized protein n=1 Tax=Rasamsonia byssochlamydoides TaxID=89139 RepID=UPI0037438E3B